MFVESPNSYYRYKIDRNKIEDKKSLANLFMKSLIIFLMEIIYNDERLNQNIDWVVKLQNEMFDSLCKSKDNEGRFRKI